MMKFYQQQVSKLNLSPVGYLKTSLDTALLHRIDYKDLYPGIDYPYQSALVYNFRYDWS